MVMHVEVLKRVLAEDADALVSVATIQGELARLARMLPAAFEVLGLERGPVTRLSLRSLVDRALVEHRLAEVTVQDGPWPDVEGDADLLVLAIAHLVRNALAATHSAGRTDRPPLVAVEREPGHVTLVVRDWGPGFKHSNPKVQIRLAGVGLLTV